MRKIIAITLVVLVLFNTVGFYGVLVGLRYKAKKDIVQRLDHDQYRHEETVTLKVPLSIPYNTDDEDYKRVNGEVAYEGEFYRLFKQKLAHDTLYIVCIKDSKSKHITKALGEYVKSFTDSPADSKSQGKTQINFIKEFLSSSFFLTTGPEGWNRSVIDNLFFLSVLNNRSITFIGPPPKS